VSNLLPSSQIQLNLELALSPPPDFTHLALVSAAFNLDRALGHLAWCST